MAYIGTQMDTLAFALSQPANNNQPSGDKGVKNNDVNPFLNQIEVGTKPLWAQKELRLDPFKLPQVIEHKEMKQQGFSLTLNHDGANFYHVSQDSKSIAYNLPINAFKGVVAHSYENGDGTTTVTLELMHENPALSIPLLASTTLDDVVADWHAWSRALSLPMLMREVDGNLVQIKDQQNNLMAKPSQPRRRRSFAINHRPKFAMRRKIGLQTSTSKAVGAIKPLSADEIINRDAL